MSDPTVIARKVETFLASHPRLSVGLGTWDEPCSIAAINLALTGELTDMVPDCMSLVIGDWIKVVQDAMPAEMRDSTEWRGLLPAAAGTGRDHERERARLDVLLDNMWSVVLPLAQPIADKRGFGSEWQEMCDERTSKAAFWAAAASDWANDYAYQVGLAATHAGYAADMAAFSPACAVGNVAIVYPTVIRSIAWNRPNTGAVTDAWATIDPPGLLARMIAA
jgi:hypothetical protein